MNKSLRLMRLQMALQRLEKFGQPDTTETHVVRRYECEAWALKPDLIPRQHEDWRRNGKRPARKPK